MNDDQDVRMGCLQMATQLHCDGGGSSDPKTVLATAKLFHDWVLAKETPGLVVIMKRGDE